ncbi:MAG: ATP-binding protein [Cyanobacteria bacterium J06598_4]
MTTAPQRSNILWTITDPELQDVNLNNCDREPIHIPNLIQPHGVLLAVETDTYRILQVSLNTKEMLGIEPESLLGLSLVELLGEQQVATVQHCLANDFEHINPLPLQLAKAGSSRLFDGIVHRQGKIIILELEPSSPSASHRLLRAQSGALPVSFGDDEGGAYAPDRPKDGTGRIRVCASQTTEPAVTVGQFDDFYRLIKNPVKRIQQTASFSQLCEAIAIEIKQITGFDRVMIYRFAGDGSGTVVAEAAEADLEPFLGLRYPATDIPKQAKHLYTLNFLRLIADVSYEPVGITPQLNPLTNKPLDLSLATLRSVSPLHTEYLNNMGVGASMSISLVKEGQLWGLIACHHQTAKKVSYDTRTVCEFIGQMVSYQLAASEKNQDSSYQMKLKSIQSQFVEIISQTKELETGLTQNPQLLLDLVGASGAALSLGDEIISLGTTPEAEEIAKMLPWLENQFGADTIYETDCLTSEYTELETDKAIASGLLALQISRVQQTYIIWFRPEVAQTVNWGGNPAKAVETVADGTVRMSPRKSFAKWQETVRGKSLPWKTCEIEAALELRSSIVGIILRKADQLAQINQELSRSNTELDAFAYIASHDLKEPLRGIYNYSSFLIEDYGKLLGNDGADKLNTLMQLTHRMEDLINSLLHYSRLGRAELRLKSIDLNDLLAGVLQVIKASARDTQVEFNIPRPLPTIKCDGSQINELFTNLISNGIKYNQQPHKIIEIGYLTADDPNVAHKMQAHFSDTQAGTIFYVRDNGIGIRERHLESIFRIFKRLHGQKKYGGGTGAGLTIAKKIVERHGGEIWIESVYQAGTTFYFTLQ